MKDNIVLIGMPSCGKSTIGVVLAKTLGYNFLDSDLLIQQKTGLLLNEIIESVGIEEFCKIEDEVNASIDCHRTVIATGGSVVYCEKAMEHLKSIGTVVYLELSYNTILVRIGDIKDRGVSIRIGQTFKDLYEERKPLYEKYADEIVNAEYLSIREVVRILQRRVMEN